MTEQNLMKMVVLISDFMTLAQALIEVSRREWCKQGSSAKDFE